MTKVVLCGNRAHLFEYLAQYYKKSDIAIWAIAGSYMERWATTNGYENLVIISSRSEFISFLSLGYFDVFISNGCPYIVPHNILSRMGSKIFINVHPSALPDLRGADPVPGAILHNRSFGASCHIIDRSIDTGALISQVSLKNNDDEFVTQMYPIIFGKEREVFQMALERNFQPIGSQTSSGSEVYYTFSSTDNVVSRRESITVLSRKFRAFDNWNKGLWLKTKSNTLERIVQINSQTNDFEIYLPYSYETDFEKFHNLSMLDGDITVKTCEKKIYDATIQG